MHINISQPNLLNITPLLLLFNKYLLGEKSILFY